MVFGLVALWLGWRWALRKCEAANVADWGNRWINRLDGLNRLFCRHFHRLGRQDIPLPARGGALVVSNHVSGLDPLLLIAASPRPLRFLIAREEYERWWLTWLFRASRHPGGAQPQSTRSRRRRGRSAFGTAAGAAVPDLVMAARRPLPGSFARESVAGFAAAQRLEAGEVVALFPHGHIHLDHHPPRPLKRGVALLARATGVPIIAVRLDGVRGQGRTISAVFLRSRVRLRHHAPLLPDGPRGRPAVSAAGAITFTVARR